MKLILFCDYGLDDASATVDALSHSLQDGYEEVVLVAIGGNVPSEVSLNNAKKLVTNCNFPHSPVIIIDTTAIVQPSEYLKDIHGNDGMGDLFEICSYQGVVLPFDSWLKSFTGQYHLLSLGPMTLIPQMLAKDGCEKFIFMGGNVAEIPNFHGYEFNYALDRRAFSEVVLKYPHIAVTMDTCRNEKLNIQEKEIIGEDLSHKIVRRCKEMTFHSGEKGCYIWDDMAVKVLRHPEWFALERMADQDGNELTVAKYSYEKEYLDIILQ